MNGKYPQNTPEARKAARMKRRRRLRLMRAAIMLTVILVLGLVVALVVLRAMGIAASKRGETTTFLAVKAIEVEGDSRYTDEQILQESGLYVGQSLLAVNKVQAHQRLMQAFPYLDWVEIGNSSFDTVRIQVRETAVLGAVEASDGWLVLGANNHALERLAADGVPEGMLRIRGAATVGEAIGDPLLDERSLRVTTTIIDAAATNKLEGITGIDLTEKTNIRLWWKDRIEVVLGNESNLAAEIDHLPGILESMLKNNGETAAGRLDMSSYADDNPNNDRAIYTPAELLPPAPDEGNTSTTDGASADGSTTTATAA